MANNNRQLSNQLIHNFLKSEYCFQLYLDALYAPTIKNQLRLNKAFQDYYSEIHLIRYISKTLSRYAKDFLLKEGRNQKHYLLLIDKPMQPQDSDEKQITYGDLLVDDSGSVEYKITKNGQLSDHIENRKLYGSLKELTQRQLLILNLRYYHNLTINDIASYLDITKQAVSKTQRQALSKLRKHMEKSG